MVETHEVKVSVWWMFAILRNTSDLVTKIAIDTSERRAC